MSKIQELQDRCKRDPPTYHSEFQEQFTRFTSFLEMFQLNPEGEHEELSELICFLAALASTYRKDLAKYPQTLIDLLDQQAQYMSPKFRLTIVKSIILMRNRDIIGTIDLLPVFFRLFSLHDKVLRATLTSHIIADVKRLNHSRNQPKVNAALQRVVIQAIHSSESPVAAQRALKVLEELWRRKVWRDARVANAIADTVFHKDRRLVNSALRFMLQDQQPLPEDEEEEELEEGTKAPTQADLRRSIQADQKVQCGDKTKRRHRIERNKTRLRKLKQDKSQSNSPLVPLLLQLRDPHTYAERISSLIGRSRLNFKTRLLAMELCAQVIGVHKCLVDNFYAHVQRYVAPKQEEVTRVLEALVTSCHRSVPEETLLPIVRKLIDDFVNDVATPDAITVGLTVIREISERAPHVVASDPTILEEVVRFKYHKGHKGISAAAKSVINLYRRLAPELLPKKERGRQGTEDVMAGMTGAHLIEYGQTPGHSRLPGLEEAGIGSEEEETEGSDADSSDGGWEVMEEGDEVSMSALSAVKRDARRIANIRSRLLHVLKRCRQKDKDVPEDYWEPMEAMFGPLDPRGYPTGEEPDSCQEEGCEGGCGHHHGDDAPEAASDGVGDDEGEGEEDSESSLPEDADGLPVEARRLLTGKELAKLGARRSLNDREDIDLYAHIRRKKSTREERVAVSREGTAHVTHKSMRWGRKTGGSTNQEKEKGKNMLMIAQSAKVVGKKQRAKKVKVAVAKEHARLQKMKYKRKSRRR
eukprot:gnl/Dysnectes_brevis/1389_a1565_1679.p1 GENE.gnl/Dysnectes_brevis/1389_a1565_1679~~gnl/Dysnectes_brevis/1389_a1565_1679.p1  ORF type:complete len:756 (-),score=263.39 gnl/Dysnectes_brevis/1389_a1565_1679:159-2426(-)